MKRQNIILPVALLLMTVFLTGYIATRQSSDHPSVSDDDESGIALETRRLGQDDFEIEIGFSEATPSHLQASLFSKGEQVDPGAVRLDVSLVRPDKGTENLTFVPDNNLLKSLEPIDKPHTFKVLVKANHQGSNYQWEYWQIEQGIEMDSADLEKAGIEMRVAGPAEIGSSLTLPGQIQANPRRLAHVAPRIPGVVIEVRKYLGDAVKTGEILAVLESRDLADLKSRYLVATRQMELAKANFERERQLWKEKISAKADYLIAKNDWATSRALAKAAAQKLGALTLNRGDLRAIASGKDNAFSRYELKAPFAGEVVAYHLALGESVNADTRVYTIADLSTVWGEINVYTKNLSAVQIGQTVRIRAQDTALSTTGKVFYIEPIIDAKTRSTQAFVEIENANKKWHPGFFITAEILKNRKPIPVAVTVDAVQNDQEQNIVFVWHDGLFEARPVVTGRQNEQWIEIREGLDAGEHYASQNSFVLKSEFVKSSMDFDD